MINTEKGVQNKNGRVASLNVNPFIYSGMGMWRNVQDGPISAYNQVPIFFYRICSPVCLLCLVMHAESPIIQLNILFFKGDDGWMSESRFCPFQQYFNPII